MKKTAYAEILLLFFIILTLFLTGFSREKITTSDWLNSPLNIDGSSDDWGDAALNFEKKVCVDYAFKNDAENLFVLFIFKDPKYSTSINATGMTVWFDTEGKKKKNFGITFIKKKVSADFYISYLEQQRGQIPEEERKKILANPSYVFHNAIVINKKSKSPSQPSDAGEIAPAIFRSKNQNKILVYEFVIPLKRLTENATGIGTEPGKIIKVCFEWGGISDEMRKRMLQRQVDSGGKSTGVADSWFKNSTSVSVPKSSQVSKKYSFWVNVQLAQTT